MRGIGEVVWVARVRVFVGSGVDLMRLFSEHPPERVVHRSELRKAIHVVPLSIEGKMYGTRLSTVLLVRRDGEVLFVERDIWKLDHDGTVTRAPPESQRLYRFQLE